jgi:elongation factor G
MGRLRSRRVRIRGTDFRDNGYIVEGDIPLLEASGLDADLRSMTSGVATVAIAPSHDELMPPQVMSQVLEQLGRK